MTRRDINKPDVRALLYGNAIESLASKLNERGGAKESLMLLAPAIDVVASTFTRECRVIVKDVLETAKRGYYIAP